MNDFLTDDFVNKNIRVRPTSGKDAEEPNKEMRSYGSKAHVNSDLKYKDELDDNNDEIEFQRKQIKNLNREKEEEMQRKLKLEEKNKK